MSATDRSPVCPIPVQTGIGQSGDGPGHGLGVEGHQVGFGSPATHEHHQITGGTSERRDPAGQRARRGGSLHLGRNNHHGEGEARSPQLAEEVVEALGAGTRHQADPQRQIGHRQLAIATEEALGFERLEEGGPARRQPAQEGVDVHVRRRRN